MDVQSIVPIIWQNQRVLTSVQLAGSYETTPNAIKENFRYAKKYFKEGVHYFKVTGEALRDLKEHFNDVRNSDLVSPIPKMANCLYLWTYQGCVRHCKMLNTQQAWDMFNELERVYFGVIKGEVELPEVPAPEVANNVEQEMIRLQNQFAKPCTNLAVVYCLLMGNGTVKIGMTKDLTDRIKQIQAESGIRVLDYRTTPFMNRDDAAALESALLEKFSPFAMGGEFFDCRFLDVAKDL